jgi:hypothetical protein
MFRASNGGVIHGKLVYRSSECLVRRGTIHADNRTRHDRGGDCQIRPLITLQPEIWRRPNPAARVERQERRMTNDAIAASIDGGVFSLARQTGDILAELRSLLQRAASALEAPDHLNRQERSQLIEELFAASIEEEEL